MDEIPAEALFDSSLAEHIETSLQQELDEKATEEDLERTNTPNSAQNLAATADIYAQPVKPNKTTDAEKGGDSGSEVLLPPTSQPASSELMDIMNSLESGSEPVTISESAEADTHTAPAPPVRKRPSLTDRLSVILTNQRSSSKVTPPPLPVTIPIPVPIPTPRNTVQQTEEYASYDGHMDDSPYSADLRSEGRSLHMSNVEAQLLYGSDSRNDTRVLKDALQLQSTDTPTASNPIEDLASTAVAWIAKIPNMIVDDPPEAQPRAGVEGVRRSTSSSIGPEQSLQLVTPEGDVLELAQARRNTDFHALFPGVETEEMLIDDYTCAWLNDVLLHGRMYISEKNLCFFTKVIWTYKFVIPLDEITLIEKKVVGGIFDNAMEISTGEKKYYFTSFLARNHAHDNLIKVMTGGSLNIVVAKAVPDTRIKRSPSTSLSDAARRSRSMGSMDEARQALFAERALKRNSLLESRSSTSSDTRSAGVGLAEIVNASSSPTSFVSAFGGEEYASTSMAFTSSKKHIVHKNHQVVPPSQAELDALEPRIPALSSLPMAERSQSPSKIEKVEKPFECECCKSIHGTWKKSLDTTAGISMSIQEAWIFLFSLQSVKSGFQGKMWEELKYTDINVTEWVPLSSMIDSTLRPEEPYLDMAQVAAGWTRRIDYIRPLNNPLGPKVTRCTVVETIKFLSKYQICVDSVTQSPDVPSGTCFDVRTRFCVLFQTPTTCRLLASCTIEYSQTTWIKMVLEAAVPEGVREYQVKLATSLAQFILTDPSASAARKLSLSTTPLVDPFPSLSAPATTADPANPSQEPRGNSIVGGVRELSFDEFCKFIQHSHYGVAILVLMVGLIVLNVMGIYFVLRLHHRLDVLENCGGGGRGGGGGSGQQGTASPHIASLSEL